MIDNSKGSSGIGGGGMMMGQAGIGMNDEFMRPILMDRIEFLQRQIAAITDSCPGTVAPTITKA